MRAARRFTPNESFSAVESKSLRVVISDCPIRVGAKSEFGPVSQPENQTPLPRILTALSGAFFSVSGFPLFLSDASSAGRQLTFTSAAILSSRQDRRVSAFRLR